MVALDETLLRRSALDGSVASTLANFHRSMHAVDLEAETAWDNRYVAEIDLKELEEKILGLWQEKKAAAEHWMRRHAALKGTCHAMRATQRRYELNAQSLDDDGSGYLQGDVVQDACVPASHVVDASAAVEVPSPLDSNPAFLHVSSGVSVDGEMSAEDLALMLMSEHPGSKDHPYGCRACHFHAGHCWKGLSCSFCHICSKPRRKSKHQRDVDRRRQARADEVKETLGQECVSDLRDIDCARRRMLLSGDELKKRVKEAYASGDEVQIRKVKTEVGDYLAYGGDV